MRLDAPDCTADQAAIYLQEESDQLLGHVGATIHQHDQKMVLQPADLPSPAELDLDSPGWVKSLHDADHASIQSVNDAGEGALGVSGPQIKNSFINFFAIS